MSQSASESRGAHTLLPYLNAQQHRTLVQPYPQRNCIHCVYIFIVFVEGDYTEVLFRPGCVLNFDWGEFISRFVSLTR